MNILGIIPARSNSKGIKNKNIKIINGKINLLYKIEFKLISHLILAQIAINIGKFLINTVFGHLN